jgi:PEP-CTERM motif
MYSGFLSPRRIATLSRAAFLLSFLTFVCFVSSAKADTVSVVGNANGNLATATVNCTFNAQTNTFTFTVTNTSPFDARITGVGYDLVAGDFTAAGSSGLNGFSGANVGNFTFSDAALGNVPQFGSVVLDFGFITGSNFSGGTPNEGIGPGGSLVFTVSGTAFTGMSEEEICNAVFVRFQRVGEDGEGSDVGAATSIPEPTSMLLLGTGLLGFAGWARRLRKKRTPKK